MIKNIVLKNTNTLIIIFAFFVVTGFLWFAYFSLNTKSDTQDTILTEIREGVIKTQQLQDTVDSNNDRLKALDIQVRELTESNKELTLNICILQNQIISLGSVPRLERNSSCDNIM